MKKIYFSFPETDCLTLKLNRTILDSSPLNVEGEDYSEVELGSW